MEKFKLEPAKDEKRSIDYIVRRIVRISDKKIIIKNKIREKLDQFCKDTGTNKVWIANQIGLSKSALSQISKSDNPTIETLIKFSLFFECDIIELFEYEIEDLDMNKE